MCSVVPRVIQPSLLGKKSFCSTGCSLLEFKPHSNCMEQQLRQAETKPCPHLLRALGMENGIRGHWHQRVLFPFTLNCFRCTEMHSDVAAHGSKTQSCIPWPTTRDSPFLVRAQYLRCHVPYLASVGMSLIYFYSP